MRDGKPVDGPLCLVWQEREHLPTLAYWSEVHSEWRCLNGTGLLFAVDVWRTIHEAFAVGDLLEACKAVQLLRDSFDETDDDDLLAARCPVCSARWTVRECRVMLNKLAGKCMCGKWSFDLRAAIAKAEGGAA